VTLAADTEVLLSDDDTIRYSLAMGAAPWLCFGTLTLTKEELVFRPQALLWTPSLACIPIKNILSVQVKRGRGGFRRRLMWILSAAIIPLTGVLWLPWLATFWPRAGNSTLEVSARPWLFGRTRVYMVHNPEQWAETIDRLIAAQGEI
jgi:hypothetical protein